MPAYAGIKTAFYYLLKDKYVYLLAVHILKFFEAVEIDLLSKSDKKTFEVFNVWFKPYIAS